MEVSTDYFTAAFGLTAGFILFICLIGIIAYVIFAFFLSQVFGKMGIEPWKAWVPIYNYWVFLEAGGFAGALSLLIFVPLVGGIAVTIIATIAASRISRGFGKDAAFAVLFFFLPPVWAAIVGLDKSPWMGLPDGLAPGGSSAAGSARGAGMPYGAPAGAYGPGNYNQGGAYGQPGANGPGTYNQGGYGQAPQYGAPGQYGQQGYGNPQTQPPQQAPQGMPQQHEQGMPQQQQGWPGQQPGSQNGSWGSQPGNSQPGNQL